MGFVIFSPVLLIVLTYFSIGTKKAIYFSEFFPKQVSCSSDFFPSTFMIKW